LARGARQLHTAHDGGNLGNSINPKVREEVDDDAVSALAMLGDLVEVAAQHLDDLVSRPSRAQIDDLPQPAATDVFDDHPVVSPPRPPTQMTHHPIGQIAFNGNPKSQENRRRAAVFLRTRLFHPPRFARRLNGSTILHERLPPGIQRTPLSCPAGRRG